MEMFRRGLTMVLAALLALPVAGGSDVGEAKKKFRNKTRTVTVANGEPITIPGSGTEGNADPFPSTVRVSGFKKGKIRDVNVTLSDLSHTDPNDLGVMVVAPNGRAAILMGNAGGGGDVSDITVTFDDEAGAVIPSNGPLTAGTFRASKFQFPSDSSASYFPLSAFDSTNPNGTWQLFVFDDSSNETGALAGGWSLTIRAKEKIRKKR